MKSALPYSEQKEGDTKKGKVSREKKEIGLRDFEELEESGRGCTGGAIGPSVRGWPAAYASLDTGVFCGLKY